MSVSINQRLGNGQVLRGTLEIVDQQQPAPVAAPNGIRACMEHDAGSFNTVPLFKVKYRSKSGNVETYGVGSDKTLASGVRRLWLRKLTKKSNFTRMAKCTRYAKGFPAYLPSTNGSEVLGEA